MNDSGEPRVEQTAKNCLPCKIISYCATLGISIYGYQNVKKQPISGAIISLAGLAGLSALAYKDLSKSSRADR